MQSRISASLANDAFWPIPLPPMHMPPQSPMLVLPSMAGSLPHLNYSFYHTYLNMTPAVLLPPPTFQYQLPSMIFTPEFLNEVAETLHGSTDLDAAQSIEWRNELLRKAQERYNAGDAAGSLVLLQEIHVVYPKHIPTLLLMGCCCHAMSHTPMAIQYNQKILAIDPAYAEAHSNLGTIYRSMGMTNEAEICYRRALELKPHYWDALSNLASLLGAVGRFEESIHLYEILKTMSRTMHIGLDQIRDVHNSLGNLYFATHNIVQAQHEFETALKITGIVVGETSFPHLMSQDNDLISSILQNLARIYQYQTRLHAAIACYYSSLAVSPRDPTAVNNLGILLNALQLPERVDESIQWYTYGLSLDPGHVHLYTNLGSALKDRGRYLDAINCYLAAIRIKPDFYIALANLGNLYKDIGKHEDAIHCYRSALIYKPDFVEAVTNLVHTLMFVCDWRDRSRHFTKVQDILECQLNQSGVVPSILPFHTFTYPLSIRQIREISIRHAKRISEISRNMCLATTVSPTSQLISMNRRLRIGYVSSDFGNHPLSHLMQSVFGFHNRTNYRIFCYALSTKDGSSYRAKIEAESEHFRDVSQWSTADIVQLIMMDEIDVLVNLNGYTKGARNEIFAARPCSVQLSYMGFAGTMGADWIDYFVVDEVACPEEIIYHDGGLYTERLIYMPHSYFVNDHMQGFRSGVTEVSIADTGGIGKLSFQDTVLRRLMMRQTIFPSLSTDAVIFANFNQLYKIDPAIFRTWLRILDRVPHSVLWLLKFPEAGEVHLKRFAQENRMKYCPGITYEELDCRIIFTDVAAKQEHICRGAVVDLFLDTPECNAHTTAADVLWAGTPMITFPKIKLASRVAAGMAYASGLGREMVVSSYREYEERAVELALHPEKLMALRKHLTETRESSRLFDTKRWVRNFESALQAAYEHQGDGCRTPIRIQDPDDCRDISELEASLIIGRGRVLHSIPENLTEVFANLHVALE